jgi:uncharacterized protein YbjT (DUF2867 family)
MSRRTIHLKSHRVEGRVPRSVFVAGATGYIGRHTISALVARGHHVHALVRPGSESRAPAGCELVVGDPFDRETFARSVTRAETFLQLVGVPHPSPSKTRQFLEIDLRSATESIAAAKWAGIDHFVYVSVAQPAPVMKAYQSARAQAEQRLAVSGVRHTIVRPWYVLGPGHRWPYALVPIYWMLERIPSTRDSARRLGLVTLDQMVAALVDAVEHPPERSRIVEVPAIRSQTRTSTAAAD